MKSYFLLVYRESDESFLQYSRFARLLIFCHFEGGSHRYYRSEVSSIIKLQKFYTNINCNTALIHKYAI